MSALRSVIAAFSCFSSIPMPHTQWDERDMRLMMAAFPLVGAVIGLLVLAWWTLCQALGFGDMLRGTGLTLIPLVVSGGIHMDGFADVVDALSSHASPERKRAILKDPHAGAFASMGIGAYLLAFCALACEVGPRQIGVLACAPVVSRCLSGLATVALKPRASSGMLAHEHATARQGVVGGLLVAELVAVAGLMVACERVAGILAPCAAVVSLLGTVRLARREFGGMSGDLAGFFLQVSELAMLACIALAGKVW